MPELSTLLAFTLVALGMVLTPGPNMVYLISRSIAQGPMAGMVSLGGIALFLRTRPLWSLAQRWLMGTVLAGFALRMAYEARR